MREICDARKVALKEWLRVVEQHDEKLVNISRLTGHDSTVKK
jgi:hypothetical protein